jgi:hypothetical protein
MDSRDRIPLWLPPLLLAAATFLLFRSFILSDDMLYGSDTLSLGYMARDFYADALADGGFPLWSPLLLGGIPFVDALASGDSLYPTSLLLLVMETHRALGWKLVLHVFAAGLFMFGWTRSLGRSRAAATVAGMAYSVAPFLVTLVRPGHDGKLFVTALTPLLFWAMEWTFVRRGLLPYVGVALVVALVTLTTHFQLAYFLFGAAGLYYGFRVVSEWRGEGGPRVGWKGALARFALFLTASVAGASVAGVQLVPAVTYVTEHSRRTATTTEATAAENRAYASSWSLHAEEVASLVVPEFPGNDAMGEAEWTQGTYWGRNALRDNHQYAGLAVLLLAAVGFLGTPRRALRGFLAGLGALAILYALGSDTPVWRIFYEVVPGIGLFRAPDMVAFLFGFSAVSLAAFGVDRLLASAEEAEGGWSPPAKLLVGAAGLLLVGTLLAASGVLFDVWTGVVYRDIDPSKQAALETLRPFVVRGFFVAVLLSGVLAATAWAAGRGLLRGAGIVGVLLLVVFLDGYRVSAPFVQTFDYHEWARPDPIVSRLSELQAEEPPFRVAHLARGGQEVKPAMFGLELATGHHPNDLARYRELIGMRGSGFPEHLLDLDQARRGLLAMPPNVYRVLNVRYLVVPGALGGETSPVLQTQAGGRIYESLYELDPLPRARLVAEAEVVSDEEAVGRILDPSFDPASTVLLSAVPPTALPGGPVQGSVEWLERGVNRQRLRVRSDRAALLVVADNWFPAWKAAVDGEPAPVLRAYHTLRAVPVPPGEHDVELRYESGTLRSSLTLSLLTLVLLLGAGVVDVLEGRRGRSGG